MTRRKRSWTYMVMWLPKLFGSGKSRRRFPTTEGRRARSGPSSPSWGQPRNRRGRRRTVRGRS